MGGKRDLYNILMFRNDDSSRETFFCVHIYNITALASRREDMHSHRIILIKMKQCFPGTVCSLSHNMHSHRTPTVNSD